MQLAAVEPEIVVQPPAPVVTSPADDLAEFVNDFDGGDCFAAQVAGEPDTPTLVAFAVDFADSVALQFALSRDFPQAVQFAGYRAEAAQCGALHFVSRLQRMGSAPATVVLEAERIADGGEIVGRASVPADTTVHLFIVDDEGIVSDATDYLAADGAFAAPVRLTGPQGAGRLQLVIALGASAPLTPPTGQQPAAEYFATLADQMGEAGGDHAVAIAAFAIE